MLHDLITSGACGILLQVDFKVENRTAIHVACANGSADVLKVLLEYKADTEIPVSSFQLSHSTMHS